MSLAPSVKQDGLAHQAQLAMVLAVASLSSEEAAEGEGEVLEQLAPLVRLVLMVLLAHQAPRAQTELLVRPVQAVAQQAPQVLQAQLERQARQE